MSHKFQDAQEDFSEDSAALMDWALGELPPRKQAEVERRIAADPEYARRAEECRKTLDSVMDWLEEAPALPAGLEEMAIPRLANARPSEGIRSRVRPGRSQAAPRRWVMWAAAVLLIIPPAAAWMLGWRMGGGASRMDQETLLAMKAGKPVWLHMGGKITPPGDEITTTEEMRQLARLASEVDAALDRQTRARVLDETTLSLAEGSVWLWVKPGGPGYTVQTSAGSVRTLGTQFGVTIRGGKLTVEVVQGKVRVSDAAGGQEIVESGAIMSGAGSVGQAEPRAAGLRLPDWVQTTVTEGTRTLRHLHLPGDE